MTRKELRRFLEPEIKKIACYYVGDGHHQDIIYIGKKTNEKFDGIQKNPVQLRDTEDLLRWQEKLFLSHTLKA